MNLDFCSVTDTWLKEKHVPWVSTCKFNTGKFNRKLLAMLCTFLRYYTKERKGTSHEVGTIKIARGSANKE